MRPSFSRPGVWCLLALALLLPAEACAADITIAVGSAGTDDKGLTLACDALAGALQGTGHKAAVRWMESPGKMPLSDVILVGHSEGIPGEPWRGKPEAYRIGLAPLSGRRVLLVEGDERGRTYGLHWLARQIRTGRDVWQVAVTRAPAFPIRVFSEEGQLLDIPDRGYYTDEAPYVNEGLLRKEADELKKLIREVAALGYNTFALLHLGVEEYIDYRYLDKAVYAPDDPHRQRTPIFCAVLKDLCDYAHALHVDVYLQVYEIQYPQRLHELYNVDLDSPHIARIIHARYRELFERVPLDGMIITATETHPRVAYKSKALWRKKGRAGAARMITLYHNACEAAGKQCMFRLWRIAGNAAAMKEITSGIPRDAMLSIKNGGGDFWLNWPTTDAITSGLAKTQPMVVVFDTFRQYDGWSRLFVYMKRWGKIVRTCHANGVIGLNGWGPWAEGCIWPDKEPGYLRGPQDPPISWRGHWSSFRMFTRGFTPGQANAYLLARLGWEPDADVAQIARDFAALHVGPANADAAAEALLRTEDAFAEEYIGRKGSVTHPVYIKWTMVFGPREKEMERAYQGVPPKQVLESNRRALAIVDEMVTTFARTDAAKAPDRDRYEAFAEGVVKTALYLRTFYLWRECWWRNRMDRDLTGEAKAENAAALAKTKTKLLELIDEWERFPEEAGFWHVTYRYGRPTMSPAFPYWYPADADTMEESAKKMG